MNINLHRITRMVLHRVLVAACVVTFTACHSQDDLAPVPDDAILVHVGGEGSLSGNLAFDLNVMFVRLDEKGGQFPEGYYATGANLVPATIQKDDNRVEFSPVQHYNPNGSATRLAGWYPAGGTWDAKERTVSFPVIDGFTDILATPATDGSLSVPFTDIPFNHILTKVQLFAYVAHSDYINNWGKLTGVELVGKAQSCTLTLPTTGDPAGTAPTASFGDAGDGNGNLPFRKPDNSAAMADVTMTTSVPDTGNDTPLGYAMFAPHTGTDDVLTLKVTTEKGGVQTIDVPYADMALEPGSSYNLSICFEAVAVGITASITKWGTGEGVEDKI